MITDDEESSGAVFEEKCSVSSCSETSVSNGSSSGGTSGTSTSGTSRLPGPQGLPVVGSMMQWKGPRTNLAWTKEYGAIYQVKMGPKTLVYLNTLELVQKHLEGKKGDQFLDRPAGPAAIGEGLLFGSGNSWQKNKRAFMKALHTTTFNDHMEGSIRAESAIAIEALQSKTGKTLKIGDIMLGACANSIVGLLLGGSLPRDSPERKQLLKIASSLEGVDLNSALTKISLRFPKLRSVLNTVMMQDIVDFYGISRKLQRLLRLWVRQSRCGAAHPPSHVSYASVVASKSTDGSGGAPGTKKRRLVVDCEAISSLDNSQNYPSDDSLLSMPKDEKVVERAMRCSMQFSSFGFSDCDREEIPYEEPEEVQYATPVTPLTEFQWTFERQMSVNPQQDSILKRIIEQPEFKHVTEENDSELLQSLMDMFFGGITSSLSGLEFALFHLAKNPGMQRLAQAEIDKCVQDGGSEITWASREQTPYLRACLIEALRLGAVTPSSLPHVARQDTEIEGFPVARGTFVMASILSLHYNPMEYMDPEEFRPQRHLQQGEFIMPESYKPYGVGARTCVGEKVSEMQLYLFTANILRNFTLKEKKGSSTETHMRIVHRLKDFKCVLEKRDLVKT